MRHTVIGRRGTMEDGEHVTEEVIVKVQQGDAIAVGHGPSEAEAAEAAEDALERFLEEQALLKRPEVAAAREAYIEAVRQAKQGDA